jgi:hypothetical protein
MANYNATNMGMPLQQQQQPMMQQFPYGNNNMLLNNNLYDNYMSRSNNQNLMPNQFLKCRPVSSRDEARAAQIDLDGSLNVFTDIGNDRIYTKKINNDGTASFITYARIEDETPANEASEYVTKDEFHKVIQNLMAAMQPANPQGQVPTPAQNNNGNGNNDAKALINF